MPIGVVRQPGDPDERPAALRIQRRIAGPAALTSGFHSAFWVSGLTGLAAVPVTFLLIRRKELAPGGGDLSANGA